MMQAVSKSLKDATLGAEIDLEFESDCVKLDIPTEGIVMTGWAIKVVTPPVVRSIISMTSFDFLT